MGPTRRLLSGATFLASLFVSAILLISTVSAAPPQKPATKTLIVKMAKGLTQAQQRAAVNGHGGSPKGSIPKLDIQILEVPEPAVDAVKKSFEGDAAILRVEENHQRRFQSIPSDAFYSNQWALPKIGWEDVYGSSSIVPRALTNVAILDTGVDASHPDLVGNIGASTSFIADADPLADANGHGTWLAGIVAARTGNLQGVAGVGFDHVQIMPVKVLGDDGLGYDSEIIQGVMWAADNGASVILMAFSNPGFSQSLQDAIDYAWSKNVVLVAAAGNDGVGDGSFPAGDKGVIGVSATDRDDNLANGSNYGASVFLAAPGVDILGTYKDHSYVMWGGTSASSAIVAGSAALMRAVDPTLDNGVVVSRIARTADPAGTLEQTGNGRVNIARALADTSTDSIQPAGSAPNGDGGPFVGPYRNAAAGPTISSLSPTSKNYGDAGFTLTVNGTNFLSGAVVSIGGVNRTTTFVSSVKLTAAILASDLTAAGTPQVKVSQDSPVKTATTNFTVNKAPLTVTADAKSRVYGEANPSFTSTLSGFVNGDTLVTSGVTGAAGATGAATTSTATTAPSSYTITPTAGTLTAANYDFTSSTYVNGSLTINKADTTTTITTHTPNPSIANSPYAVNFTLTAKSPGSGTPTGNVTVSDGSASCTATVAAGTCNLTSTTAGSKTLTATYAGDSNFKTSSDTDAHQVNAGKLVFTSGVFIVNMNQCSPVNVVQSQTGAGSPLTVASALTVSLSSSAATGKFYKNTNCSGGANEITSTTIAAGSSISGNFYYIDTASGSPLLTVSATNYSSGSQTETINANTAPVATAQAVTTNQNTAKAITLSGTDADGNSLTFSIVGSPSHGSLGSIGTVSCSGSPSTCSASVTYTPTTNYSGADSFTFKVNDGSVDSSTATVSIDVKDVTAPTTAGSPSPAANAGGWNNSNVTVTLTATDNAGGSGVQNITYAVNGGAPTTVAGSSTPVSVTSEGTSTVSFHATDIAANIESPDKTLSVKIDKVKPTISAAATTSANAQGWYAGNVTIHYTCADSGSGIATCPADETLTASGTTTAKTATDNAGNTSLASNTVTVQIDNVKPTISAAATGSPNAQGWYNASVTIHYTCADAGSGIATCPVDEVLSASGTTTAKTATDNAGNTSLPSNTITVQIDTAAPTVSAATTVAPNAQGWYNADVTIHYTCSDSGSGIASCPANETLNASATTTAKTASDIAGNTSTPSNTVTVQIDKAPPTITGAATTSPNANGWYSTAVTIHFTCNDSGSGVLSCPTDVVLNTSGSGQSAGGTVTDNAGNTANTTVSGINIDLAIPTISAAATTAPNVQGWYSGDVTIHYTCNDVGSGVDTCPADETLNASGSTTSKTASDKAGNSSAASNAVAVQIDKVAPTISGAPTTAPNANGWYSGPVTIHFTCNDANSGVLSCPSDVTLSVDGANQSASGTVTDNAGNTASTTVSGIKIDLGAPTISAAATSSANLQGWYNGDVTIHYTCNDAASGIATCPVDETLNASATTTAKTATDNAGNTSAPSNTVTVQIDKAAPTISGAPTTPPNPNGWYSGPVTIHFTCNDANSGVLSCPSDVTLSADGANQSASGTVTDNAGNTASTTVSGIKIDLGAPTISAAATSSANLQGWYNSDVTIHYTCNDAGSGIATCPVDETLNASGTTIAKTATDNAGNTSAPSNTVTVQIDKAAPTISGAPTTPPNPNGWYSGPVTIHFTCNDANSGVLSCPSDVVLSGNGANQSTGGTVTDNAGNTASTTVSGINIDLGAPTISAAPTSPANAQGWYNSDVTIQYTCNDAGSGIATCPVAETLNASGTTTAKTATDNAGNTSALSNTVTVQIDKAAPTISGAPTTTPNANGWYSGAVTIHFTCGDANSGVLSCPSDVVLSGDGANQSASGTVTDNAGNTASTTVSGIKIDLGAPTISAAATSSANLQNWYNSDVTIHYTCSDAGSGIATCPVDETLNASATTTAKTATDNAGNISAPSNTVTVQIDKAAPTISGAPTTLPNANGWYSGPVTIHFTCGDTNSGVLSCPSDVVLSGNGANQSTGGTVTDNAGNTASTTVGGINIDLGAPTISAAPTSPANAQGWYNGAVTIHYTCNDAGSGIETCPVDETLNASGTTTAKTATDNAGNTSAPSNTVTVQIDKVAPTISGAPTTTPNANGWYSGPVTIHFTCGDANSGVLSCPSDVVLSGNGAGQSTGGTVTDNAGNTASTTVSGIDIDLGAPTISAAPTSPANAQGWYNGDVTIHYTCADAGSGIATCPVDETLSASGTTIAKTATDKAGNTSAPSNTVTVQIDKAAPTISGAATTSPNANGWYSGPVTIHFTCADSNSGVLSCPADVTLSGDGAAQSTGGTVTDNAGNTASTTVSGINIDLGAPTVSAAATTLPNAQGWYNGNVTIHYTCSDAGSGVATCPVDETLSASGTTIAKTATDNGGNTSLPSNTVTVQIDKAAPTISGAPTTTANANGYYSGPVTIHFTCGDANSGVLSCPTDVVLSGDGANQSTGGTVTDNAGNTASTTVSGIKIDLGAPTISAAATSTPNAQGWYNGDVTIRYTCNDAGSGIATCPGDETLNASGTTIAKTATDNAGNTSTPSNTVTVKIDKAAPTINGATTTLPNPANWYAGPVTVHFICADSNSGILSCTPDVTLTLDGAGQSVPGTAVDNAGNTASTEVGSGINIDTTAPTISAAPTTLANGYGWYNGNVAVHYTCADAGSGVATCPVDETLSVSGTTIAKTATDNAGNTSLPSNTVTVQIDKIAPTISVNAKFTVSGLPYTPGTWTNQNVTVYFTCADDNSGIVTCPADQNFTASGTSTAQTVNDKAGNTSSATGTIEVKIDKTGPVLTLPTSPVATYATSASGAAVTYTASANDASSGLAAAISCLPASGSTFAVGSTTVNCSASDTAGNTSNGNFSVQVNKRPTSILYTGPTSRQSYDCVPLSGLLKDITGGLPGVPMAGSTISLTIGSLTPVTAVTDSTGTGTATQKCALDAGAYNATAAYAGDSWHAAATTSSVPYTVIERSVNPQAGWGVYTGSTFFWTANASSSTATLVLTATIVDASADCTGDITKAKVTFTMNGSPISGATNLSVGPVTAGDLKTGVVAAIVQYNLGNAKSAQFNLGVIISGGKYKRNTPSDTVPITVLVPGTPNSIDVQGYLSNTGSGGILAGATGQADNSANTSNISGLVQYNKGGTQPQGKITVYVHSFYKPDGTKDTVLHTYMIQSNAIAQLALNTQTGGAMFSAKSNIVDQATGATVDGGAVLQINLTPNKTTATNPTVSITVTSSKGGGLWFSSQWTGVSTIERRIFNESGLQTNGLAIVQ